MINSIWDKIEAKQPKAYKVYNDWWFENYTQLGVPSICMHTRYLYDFFDDNNIFVCVDGLWSGFVQINYMNEDGDYDIYETPILDIDFKDRKETEIHLFTKAFELLEINLKDND